MQRRFAQAFLFAVVAGLSAALTAPAQSAEACFCRHRDGQTPLGQTACIRSPDGLQMALCERVLNNTSWKFTGAPCPAALMTPRRAPARQG
jgi:hypothetical protein